MGSKRSLLFAGAAVGAILVVAGVAVVIWAWFYPKSMVEQLGVNLTPDHLMDGLRTQLFGTIGGGLIAAAGFAALFGCFRFLNRDLERMRDEMESRRGRVSRR